MTSLEKELALQWKNIRSTCKCNSGKKNLKFEGQTVHTHKKIIELNL